MGEPIRITADEQKRILNFLEEEIPLAEREVHHPLQTEREKLEDLYRGKVKPRRMAWMSNFPVQMGATFTDSVTARLLNTMTAYKPFLTIKPTRNSGWTEVATSVQELMEYKLMQELKIYPALRKTVFEAVRLGTGAMLTPWVKETRKLPKKFMGVTYGQLEVPYREGVLPRHLPIRDLRYPGGFSELNELPWWGRTMRWSKMDLDIQKARGFYDNTEEVKKFERDRSQDDKAAQERAGEEPGTSNRIYGEEIYMNWSLGQRTDYRRYIVTVHRESSNVMRVEEDAGPAWPLTLLRYGPRDYGICGLGIMEMTQPYDDALYSLYNLLVDNFKIATMQVFKGRKGRGLRPNTKIYPSKLFLLDDPAADLIPMQMGAAYTLNPSFPRMVWELGERRAGVSDYALGRESPIAGGKATATGTLALIQEGQRRFDLTVKDMRDAIDDFGMYYLQLVHSQLSRRQSYMILGEKGQFVEEFLEIPSMPPYMALAVTCSLSQAAMNKEVEKQDAVATLRLLGEYYERMYQLAMTMAAQQLPENVHTVLGDIAEAVSLKMKKVLQAYGELSPEVYTDIMAPLTMTQPMAQGAPQGAPSTGAPPQGGPIV